MKPAPPVTKQRAMPLHSLYELFALAEKQLQRAKQNDFRQRTCINLPSTQNSSELLAEGTQNYVRFVEICPTNPAFPGSRHCCPAPAGSGGRFDRERTRAGRCPKDDTLW